MLKSMMSALAFSFALAASASAQQITVYTAGPAGLAKSLAAGFEKQTGVRVNVFQATTGQIMARLTAERANPQADVLISASWETAVDLKAEGQLLAYESPNAKSVPASLKDTHYVAQGAAALAIAWNEKSGKPRPADWSDLTAPAYKDAVTIPDPALSGSAFGMVSGIVAHKDLGWKFFEAMRANGALVPGANAQALNPVLQGARAAVMGAVDYIAIGARERGESIEIIYPSSGTVLEARPAMILNTSKNQADAKRFIDYMLSDEGQTLVAGTFLLPARTDIPAKRAGWNDIKLFDLQDTDAQTRARTLQQFKTVMGLK